MLCRSCASVSAIHTRSSFGRVPKARHSVRSGAGGERRPPSRSRPPERSARRRGAAAASRVDAARALRRVLAVRLAASASDCRFKGSLEGEGARVPDDDDDDEPEGSRLLHCIECVDGRRRAGAAGDHCSGASRVRRAVVARVARRGLHVPRRVQADGLRRETLADLRGQQELRVCTASRLPLFPIALL